jgi:hypothetical protein
MPKKPRKMLSDINAPYIQSLMRLIETQNAATIANWCVSYAETHLLPLWERDFPDDKRPTTAINAAHEYLIGNIKLREVKKHIAECRNAAREAGSSHIAQEAARTIDAAVSSVHNPSGSISLAFCGALTIAYDKLGLDAEWENLLSVSAEECAKMEAALRAVAVDNEPNPANINWNC